MWWLLPRLPCRCACPPSLQMFFHVWTLSSWLRRYATAVSADVPATSSESTVFGFRDSFSYHVLSLARASLGHFADTSGAACKWDGGVRRGCRPCWHSVLQCDAPLMTPRAHHAVDLVGFPAMGPAERPSDAGTTCMANTNTNTNTNMAWWETMSRNRDRLGHPRSPLPAAPIGTLPPCGTSRLGRGSGWRGG